MEFLLVVFGLFVAWRIYLAFLKKRAYGEYDVLARSGSVEEAREQFSRAFEILAEDLRNPGRLAPADGLGVFDMAVFLQDRIEHEDGSWPKTASPETNRKDVARRLRAKLAAEVDNRRSPSGKPTRAGGGRESEPVRPKTPPVLEAPGANTPPISTFFPVLSSTRVSAKVLGKYRFLHQRDVVLRGGAAFPHAMIVYDDSKEIRLVITSEINVLAQPGSGRSHFLCKWTPSGHENLGASDKWGNSDEFSKEAISIAIQSVVLPDQLK